MALTSAPLPVVTVVEGLRDWTAAVRGWRGVKPIALPYIETLDPFVAARVGLRRTFPAVAGKQARLEDLAPIAADIGRSLEHEAQVKLWAAGEISGPPIERLAWQPWSAEVRLQVGTAVVATILRLASGQAWRLQ